VVISADLGSSSNYSNESQLFYSFKNGFILSYRIESRALKAVVEKVSLRLAIMQRSVGPKYPVKTTKQIKY
jgi:hypothetical protein